MLEWLKGAVRTESGDTWVESEGTGPGTPAPTLCRVYFTLIMWPREQNPVCASFMVTLDFSPCLRQIEHLPRTRVACSSACQTVRFASCGLLRVQDASSNAAKISFATL